MLTNSILARTALSYDTRVVWRADTVAQSRHGRDAH